MAWADFVANSLRELGTAALIWGAVFSTVALVIAILVALTLARRGVLRRETRIWSVVASLAYPWLLIGFLVAGAAAGAVYGAQRQSHEVLRTAVQPVIAANMPAYRAYVAEALSGYVPDQRVTVRELIEPYIKVYHYVPVSGSAWEHAKARVINDLMLRHAADVFIERFQAVLGAQAELPGDKPSLPAGDGAIRFTARQVSDFFSGRSGNVDWAKLDVTLPQTIVAALGDKLDRYCRSIYFGIGLGLAFLLLPLAVEMTVYARYRRRRPAPVM
jgi:hypothetical protein